jgi:ribonuclease HI
MSIDKSFLSIYTDGSCNPNPGKGGWAFVILKSHSFEDYKNYDWYISGFEDYTTNNRMELKAVIEALEFTYNIKKYFIYSDSMYVINCARGLYNRKKNKDLWDKYDKYSKDKIIKWVWVKGHSNNKYNEIVDNLAKKEVNNIYN